jgi:molybdate transport system regulatory protein
MNVKAKIWVEKGGRPVFGDGRCELLKAIKAEGSINKGAKKIGMAYKQAWDEVDVMERRLGVKLLQRRVGGKRGGGVELTEDALNLMAKYERFRRAATSAIDEEFKKAFK